MLKVLIADDEEKICQLIQKLIDLVKKTRELGLGVEFVIISGYRHFEYAQTAIKFGVSDYLLKPIRKDELTETLRKIKVRYEEKNEQITYEERVRLAMKSDVERLRWCWPGLLMRGTMASTNRWRRLEG